MRSHVVAAALGAEMVFALCCLPTAQAHGWLQEPIGRNWYSAGQRIEVQDPQYKGDRFYNPMGLNRASKGINGAYCGGEFVGDTRFDAGGQLATNTIVRTYKAGQTFKAKFKIWNNHWGYVQLRLCPIRGQGTTADEKASLSEACFKKYQLRRADNGKTKHWIYKGTPGAQFLVVQKFRLPAGLKCKRCVMQWIYVTGHQCYLPGVDKQKMLRLAPGGNRNCPPNYMMPTVLPSEKFWNCADVSIQ